MQYGPPKPEASVQEPDEPTRKLAQYLHLKWCNECGDWRDLAHDEHRKEQAAGQAQRRLEEEQFPTIG